MHDQQCNLFNLSDSKILADDLPLLAAMMSGEVTKRPALSPFGKGRSGE